MILSSLITNIGNEKLLVASPLQPLKIKSIAIGSGRGAFDANIMQLQSQNWIGDASAPIKNGKTLEFECFIPTNVGGWEVAEWGLIDIEGDLIAYGQIPEIINKPLGLMSLTPTFAIELGDSISADIIVTDEINFRHNGMTGRDAVDAHPISSITNLSTELTSLKNKDATIQAEIDLNKKLKVITSDYAMTPEDTGTILVDAGARNITVTMAKASTANALRYNLLRTDISTNIVTLKPATGDKFIGEGFSWPLAYMRTSEPFIFSKYSETGWMGIRGNRAQIGETDNIPSFSVNGTHLGRLLLEGDIKNVLNSTDTLNPLSAAQGKKLNDQAFGVGQTVKDLTASIVSGTTYTNTGLKPKFISVFTWYSGGSGSRFVQVFLNGELWGRSDTANDGDNQLTIPVPSGSTFSVEWALYTAGTTLFIKELS